MTIQNNTQFNKKLESLANDKTKLYDGVQDTIVYFVNEYNGKLSYNKNGLEKIFKILDNNAKTLFRFLKTYTNITTISYDFKDFKTKDKIEVKTKAGEKITCYTLRFNDDFSGQKWYETIEKDAKETVKQLTNAGLKAKLKNLLTTLQGNSKTENKVDIDTKQLEKVCETYITRLEQALSMAE